MTKRRPYPEDIQAEVSAANRREVKLTPEQMSALGHVKRPVLKAIRELCLDCMGGNAAEVRRCTSVGCAVWPYRFATNPFHKRIPSKSVPPLATAKRLRSDDSDAKTSNASGGTQ
jgi:hypothetical protein